MIGKFAIVGGAVLAALAFGIGIIIGHFGIKKEQTTQSWKYEPLTRRADQQIFRTFVDSVQAANIEANLKNLTSVPHMAGTPGDLSSAQVVEQRWLADNLTVTKPKYNVLLSYPNENNTNRVILRRNDSSVILQTNGTEHPYNSTQPKTVDPFLAYTPDGNASSNNFFYANYGRLEDLQLLASVVGNDSLNGSIIIMRYGLLFRGDKVMHAQYYGAVAAILYNDPADFAPFGTTPDKVYDRTWFMPPTGAQRGSAFTGNGDPLTPVYPSTDYMYRLNQTDVQSLPKIPAHPIGYAEAEVLLSYLSGPEVNSTWSGFLLNRTYHYGGVLSDGITIEVTSFNQRDRRDTYNVIGIMKGDIEPDRYVVIGNHRDAWSLGAIDPTSGTATLLEITRVLGQMYRNGYRPRRSLMFCSWGAEEYGLIGSVEYVEEYVKVLGARIISYLNLDVAVEGNYTANVKGSPMLFDAIVQAGKMVPSAYDPSEWTVYDKWMSVHRNEQTNEPDIGYGLGSGSDFLAFDQLAGSSNYDASYTYNSVAQGNIASYPLYHTSYEVFSMMKQFVDPEFQAHRSIGQLTGVLALILTETPVLPLNVSRYTLALNNIINAFPTNTGANLNPLQSAIYDFGQAANRFIERSKSMDVENPYVIRAYNDQLLQLERAFLNPLGQGNDSSGLKHVIYAPAKTNKYEASGFPAVGDALSNNKPEEIDQQIAIATYFVRGALAVLQDFNDFMNTN